MALSIEPIINVTVNLPSVGASTAGFDTALIVGESEIIPSGERVRVYNSLTEILNDGFTTTSPEYLAAVKYFAAVGSPSRVAIGRQVTGETPVAAVTACRAANTDWYMCYVIDATDNELIAVADYIEATSTIPSQLFVQSSAAAVKNNTTGNLFAAMEAAGYKRTHGMYSSTAYAVLSVAGYAMANTTNTANSAYTLKFKTLPGVTAESLTATEVSNIEGNNGNVYITRGSNTGYENGAQFSGDWFDEIIGLDKLANDMQVNVGNFLYQTASVPQTEAGVAQLKALVAQACQRAVTRGFLAPGTWTGGRVKDLNTGDTLPAGYQVFSDAISSQSDADRTARIAPPIYACVKLAGSLQSVAIVVNVNR